MLNLDTLVSMHGIKLPTTEKTLANGSHAVKIAYQYLADFHKHHSSAKNGPAMLPGINPEKPLYAVHQTKAAYADAMRKSGAINVSKAGCLGSGVYLTFAPAENGRNFVGGHGEAMFKRALRTELFKSIGCNDERLDDPNSAGSIFNKTGKSSLLQTLQNKKAIPSQSNGIDFLLFSANYADGNTKSNWIERFGSGRLFLEANFRMKALVNTTVTYSRANPSLFDAISKIETIEKNCVAEYTKLFKFLDTVARLSEQTISYHGDGGKAEQAAFKTLWSAFEQARRTAPTLLNNVLFEAVKDYVLLYGEGEDTKQHTENRTLDMDHQYEIIFDLCPPDMRTSWDTVKFSPDLSKLKSILADKNKSFDDHIFEKFLCDAIKFYVGNRLLDGNNRPPNPNLIGEYSDLARTLPNLTGILYHYLGAKQFKATTFFDEHLDMVRQCERKSAENANLNVTIKSGFFGTEEICFTSRTKDVKCYSPIFEFDESSQRMAVSHDVELPIHINNGPSTQAGFTVRVVKGG
jgi:hypothetical protein